MPTAPIVTAGPDDWRPSPTVSRITFNELPYVPSSHAEVTCAITHSAGLQCLDTFCYFGMFHMKDLVEKNDFFQTICSSLIKSTKNSTRILICSPGWSNQNTLQQCTHAYSELFQAFIQAIIAVFNAPRTISHLPQYLRFLQLYSRQHKFEGNVQERSDCCPPLSRATAPWSTSKGTSLVAPVSSIRTCENCIDQIVRSRL